LITPKQKDQVFLDDVRDSGDQPDALHIWCLGQSGFLLRNGDRFALLDPYLSDSLTRKYADTDKPHVRMTELVVDPAKLGFVDVVSSSHNHTDHLDAETIKSIMAAHQDVTIIVPEANRSFAARRLGTEEARLTGLTAGVSTEVAGFRFHGIPAAHNNLDTDTRGNHQYMGYVVACGAQTIYHSGDTLRYDRMAELLRRWDIDVAFLPINGNKPERRVAGNLDGAEAAQLARDIQAKLVIPCHYDMFEFNTELPELFVSECERLGQRYRVMEAGERVSLY